MNFFLKDIKKGFMKPKFQNRKYFSKNFRFKISDTFKNILKKKMKKVEREKRKKNI